MGSSNQFQTTNLFLVTCCLLLFGQSSFQHKNQWQKLILREGYANFYSKIRQKKWSMDQGFQDTHTNTNKKDIVWEKVTFTGAVQSCHPVFWGKTRLFCGKSGWTHVLRIKLVKRTSQTWVSSRQQRVDSRGVVVRDRQDCSLTWNLRSSGSNNLGFLPSQLNPQCTLVGGSGRIEFRFCWFFWLRTQFSMFKNTLDISKVLPSC